MIIDCEATADLISNWIKNYAVKAGIKSLIVGLSGGVDSALVALLCQKTGIPTLCVSMPCHSSSFAHNRAERFAQEYNLTLHKVDLSAAHDVIFGQAKEVPFVISGENDINKPIAVGGLRSCLRAPTLNYFSNVFKGLIVGTGNRSEDNITRYYQKFGDGCVDIAPVSDLFKNEIYQLFKHLAQRPSRVGFASGAIVESVQMLPSAQEIYSAKPTADLWGPDSGQEDEKELGISYDEIEWADREDMRTGIVKSDADPAKAPSFYIYTARQRQVLARLHHLEKASRHKINPNLPMCSLRSHTNLVQ